MLTLNKKEYPNNGIFKNVFIEEYCNLSIYPLIGVLEKEAALLSEFAEAFQSENKTLRWVQSVEEMVFSFFFRKEWVEG